jgi:glyoxylase-like metal-dependent hydrolase (beta-lactamase superfamily II)
VTLEDCDRFTQLFDDVTSRIFARYNDNAWVYPGHGAGTTLGAQRGHLDEWRKRGW